MKKQIVALLSVLLISPVFAEEVPSSEKIQLAQQLIKLDGSVAAVSSVKESMMQQIKQNLPPYIKADFFSIFKGSCFSELKRNLLGGLLLLIRTERTTELA